MEAIIKYMQDPGWWFSAFFVAILASVIAGFLKDRIEKWLSKLFSGLKAWRAEREAQRGQIIEALLKDQTYFMIALVRAVFALILFALATIIYLSGPVLLATAPESSAPVAHIDRAFVVWKVLTPLLGLFNILVGYSASRRISIIGHAIREYRKRNNLPKLL